MPLEPRITTPPPAWHPALSQAIADAQAREADMQAHLASQLDGPTSEDVASIIEWGQAG